MSTDKTEPLVVLFKSLQSNEDNTSDNYKVLIEENGFKALVIPTLSFEFDVTALLEAIQHPDCYSGFIFTSPRSVEAVQHALNEAQNYLSLWHEKRHYCVGEKTKQVAEKLLNLSNLRGDSSGSAEVLARYIAEDIGSGKLPLLFPCSNIKLETLPSVLKEHGVNFEAVTAYFTIPHSELRSTIQSLDNTVPTYLVFFSPSGISFTKSYMEENKLLTDVNKVICIGSTSAKAARESGIRVDGVCSKPTPEYLLEVLRTLSLEPSN